MTTRPNAPNARNDGDDRVRDRGEVMLMTTVLITFLVVASWALISASQQWGARRDVQAVSAAAARAAVQVSELEVRGGAITIDPGQATDRANIVLGASGYTGSVSINDLTVTVTATGTVGYVFPAPGFPTSLTATSTAVAVRGIAGNEGG